MKAIKQLVVTIVALILVFVSVVYYQPTETAAEIEETPSVTPEMIIIEMYGAETPEYELTPSPEADKEKDTNFEVKHFSIPRELEVICHKILWYSPLRSEKSTNPNYQKMGLLWTIANEYDCSLVVNSNGDAVEYSSLSIDDQMNYNFSWLFPKDSTFESIMMRPGDHDWYINSVETNQPWHESETNDRIIQIWYDVWMSEKEGMNSGRTVPREYIYYKFVKDSSGQTRKIELYKSKEDLQNGTNCFDWSVVGTLDK